MDKFLSHFKSQVTGVLSGFDRLVFRGWLLPLIQDKGMFFFLEAAGVRLLDFKDFVLTTTERVKKASLADAVERDRPIQYLESPKIDKEDLARKLLVEHPVDEGLICVLQAVEPCMTFEYHRSRDRDKRGLRLRPSKCLHIYKYFLHPRFGFMNARIQTWFPFNIQICMNGREWLSAQLGRKGVAFKRHANCFPWLADVDAAQRLMNKQLDTNWPHALDAFARSLNPLHREIFQPRPMDYYWTAYQTEWATDVMFTDPRTLADIYPALVRHAMHHLKSPDVMRFLAQKAPHGNFTGELVTSFKDRAEGVRVKHWLRGNSVKMYDKAGSILRVETTVAQMTDFKVFRPPHDDPEGKLAWRPLRKGVADLHRRAQLSQQSNNAYLDALSAADDTTPCAQLFDAVARPVIDAGRRVRALRLADRDDITLLEAIARGEFTTSGFRNHHIRRLLHPAADPASLSDQRRLSAKTSRRLRLLRAHGIIRKIPRTLRYRLTTRGTLLTAALFATRTATVKQLLANAA